MAFLELKKYRETSKDEVRKPWLEFFGNKPFTQQPERTISQADQLLDYKSFFGFTTREIWWFFFTRGVSATIIFKHW